MLFIQIKNSSFKFSSSICVGVTSSSAICEMVIWNIFFIHCWNSTFGCTIKTPPSLFGGILKFSSQQISSYPIVINRKKSSPLWAKTQLIFESEPEPIYTILVSASFSHSTHGPLQAEIRKVAVWSLRQTRDIYHKTNTLAFHRDFSVHP